MNLAIRKAVDLFGGQKKLADAVGCHVNTVNNWIAGKCNPSSSHIMKIMKLSGDSVNLADFDKFLKKDEFLKMRERSKQFRNFSDE